MLPLKMDPNIPFAFRWFIVTTIQRGHCWLTPPTLNSVNAKHQFQHNNLS